MSKFEQDKDGPLTDVALRIVTKLAEKVDSLEKHLRSIGPGKLLREWLTPSEVSALFPTDRESVYKACKSGELAHLRKRGRGGKQKYLIRRSDAESWFLVKG